MNVLFSTNSVMSYFFLTKVVTVGIAQNSETKIKQNAVLTTSYSG